MPKNGQTIKLNGNIVVTCAVLKLVAASAAEAELGAEFRNTQEAWIIRLTLMEMGHPQPSTPIHIDNITCVRIVNGTIKRQRSRVMGNRRFWILDQEAQKYFRLCHHPGAENTRHYPSNAHTWPIHEHVRPWVIQMENFPTELPRASFPSAQRECAEILASLYHIGMKYLSSSVVKHLTKPSIISLNIEHSPCGYRTVNAPPSNPSTLREKHDRHTIPVIWKRQKDVVQKWKRAAKHVQQISPFAKSELLDRLPTELRDHYESDFPAADAAFCAGRVALATKTSDNYRKHWTDYVQPLGLDPHLQTVSYKWRQRSITELAAQVREVWYGRQDRIRDGSVRTAITAIHRANVLDHGVNPTKAKHSEKLTPWLA